MKQTFGLIGYPLVHSFSAKYFKQKFEDEHIDAEYLNFEIDDIHKVTDIIQTHPYLKGFNVTIPYKQEIIPFLNQISPEAREIGAVNCVKIGLNGELTGYNTDAFGFERSLVNFISKDITHALILGNGGAAKAVRFVLHKLGMRTLTVSRTPATDAEIGYPEIAKYISDYRLIVNASPLGTFPHIQTYPDIPYQMLTSRHYLFDLVYNPEVTEFMKRGKGAGAHVHNGYEMLIGQAEKGWEIWNLNP